MTDGLVTQTTPIQYQLTTAPNGTVNYRVNVQGEFYTNFNFNSYPFDRWPPRPSFVDVIKPTITTLARYELLGSQFQQVPL